MNKRRMILLACVLTMLASCLVALAQDQVKQRREVEVTPEVKAKVAAEVKAQMADTFTFVAAEGRFGGPVVKGAPYSAEAVTENIQVLQDGNRIVRKNSSAIYRDSEGRTRQEQTIRAIGPYAAAGDPPQTIFIYDPVANIHYTLEPNSKTARKMEMPRIGKIGDGETVVYTTGPNAVTINKVGPPPFVVAEDKGLVASRIEAQGGRVEFRSSNPENVKKEGLGKQIIEGVEAEGTRETITIPAGEIGNEQPINIVMESWYSPELQVTVMRKHSDPRQGEMTYRLTNIRRTEPDRSLFEVPADYTVKEMMPAKVKLDLEKEMVREKMRKNNDQ